MRISNISLILQGPPIQSVFLTFQTSRNIQISMADIYLEGLIYPFETNNLIVLLQIMTIHIVNKY